MIDKHYREKLSAFVNHELATDERQTVAEHLLLCAECRREHDEIKFGAALAGQLPHADAPDALWRKIENALDEKSETRVSLPFFAFFNLRAGLAGLALIGVFLTTLYFIFWRTNSPETVKNTTSQPKVIQTDQPFWNVETLTGAPRIGNILKGEKLSVGEFIETDGASRARVEVADIGNVEVAPNSRVKFVNSKATEHRLSLERGLISAKILAPPRLFIVDTPSAVAVDLGCEYTLEVDPEGNSRLHVTSGFVALERGGRESIVPAGAIALTKKGKGLGTPFAANSTESFQKSLYQFDFEEGGNSALKNILNEATLYDIISLWHLLERTPQPQREKVFDTLARFVKPPAGVTRRGVLGLDQKMLKAWWAEIENVWFQ